MQVEPYPKDFGRALGTALNFHFQEHMGMLKQLVGLTGALPVSGEDSPQTTLKRSFLWTPASSSTCALQCHDAGLNNLHSQGAPPCCCLLCHNAVCVSDIHLSHTDVSGNVVVEQGG